MSIDQRIDAAAVISAEERLVPAAVIIPSNRPVVTILSPGASISISFPDVKAEICLPSIPVAPTAMTSLYAAGYWTIFSFSFPAAATKRISASYAALIASCNAAEFIEVPKLILIIFIPCSMPQ